MEIFGVVVNLTHFGSGLNKMINIISINLSTQSPKMVLRRGLMLAKCQSLNIEIEGRSWGLERAGEEQGKVQ